ncbi:MAG: NADH:ubiquinone reductase (Na(+)-transporting) subunit C [Crocinitomicaceae bacterium]|nr:NADH:ubiquinone reductase (Na(+)-transporting) subunit C [Crocinitomicaceae bacterium]MDG1734699.1 NADH:ubiquinone reductase (Na(+)-transporting) subunit C [Crocinitomicaceae bacterium]MDG2504641.1 NADH:ubiquinone reductase (Na(+)-transporting) subunit C [Crocinitomicaceae bacterium]
MALNKESNGFTFGFAIVLVVVLGVILASLAEGLKPLKEKNVRVKKQIDILSAMMDVEKEGIDRSNAIEEFPKYVDLSEAVILNNVGEEVSKGKAAFEVDIKKEYRDKNLKEEDKKFPLFIARDKEKNTRYIIPVVGKGLWGPIWGYICLEEDMKTILGVSFDHKTETPGLGAEINKPFFMDRWKDSEISDSLGNFQKYEVVKDNSGSAYPSKVDGITGGTITSKGVEEMVNRSLQIYSNYFKNLNSK